jgi:hypothetical protein
MGRHHWLGVARAISPDVRYVRRGLRSLGGNGAPPSMAPLVSYAGSMTRATPSGYLMQRTPASADRPE